MPIVLFGVTGLGLGTLFGLSISHGMKRLLTLLLLIAVLWISVQLGWVGR